MIRFAFGLFVADGGGRGFRAAGGGPRFARNDGQPRKRFFFRP